MLQFNNNNKWSSFYKGTNWSKPQVIDPPVLQNQRQRTQNNVNSNNNSNTIEYYDHEVFVPTDETYYQEIFNLLKNNKKRSDEFDYFFNTKIKNVVSMLQRLESPQPLHDSFLSYGNLCSPIFDILMETYCTISSSSSEDVAMKSVYNPQNSNVSEFMDWVSKIIFVKTSPNYTDAKQNEALDRLFQPFSKPDGEEITTLYNITKDIQAFHRVEPDHLFDIRYLTTDTDQNVTGAFLINPHRRTTVPKVNVLDLRLYAKNVQEIATMSQTVTLGLGVNVYPYRYIKNLYSGGAQDVFPYKTTKVTPRFIYLEHTDPNGPKLVYNRKKLSANDFLIYPNFDYEEEKTVSRNVRKNDLVIYFDMNGDISDQLEFSKMGITEFLTFEKNKKVIFDTLDYDHTLLTPLQISLLTKTYSENSNPLDHINVLSYRGPLLYNSKIHGNQFVNSILRELKRKSYTPFTNTKPATKTVAPFPEKTYLKDAKYVKNMTDIFHTSKLLYVHFNDQRYIIIQKGPNGWTVDNDIDVKGFWHDPATNLYYDKKELKKYISSKHFADVADFREIKKDNVKLIKHKYWLLKPNEMSTVDTSIDKDDTTGELLIGEQNMDVYTNVLVPMKDSVVNEIVSLFINLARIELSDDEYRIIDAGLDSVTASKKLMMNEKNVLSNKHLNLMNKDDHHELVDGLKTIKSDLNRLHKKYAKQNLSDKEFSSKSEVKQLNAKRKELRSIYKNAAMIKKDVILQILYYFIGFIEVNKPKVLVKGVEIQSAGDVFTYFHKLFLRALESEIQKGQLVMSDFKLEKDDLQTFKKNYEAFLTNTPSLKSQIKMNAVHNQTNSFTSEVWSEFRPFRGINESRGNRRQGIFQYLIELNSHVNQKSILVANFEGTNAKYPTSALPESNKEYASWATYEDPSHSHSDSDSSSIMQNFVILTKHYRPYVQKVIPYYRHELRIAPIKVLPFPKSMPEMTLSECYSRFEKRNDLEISDESFFDLHNQLIVKHSEETPGMMNVVFFALRDLMVMIKRNEMNFKKSKVNRREMSQKKKDLVKHIIDVNYQNYDLKDIDVENADYMYGLDELLCFEPSLTSISHNLKDLVKILFSYLSYLDKNIDFDFKNVVESVFNERKGQFLIDKKAVEAEYEKNREANKEEKRTKSRKMDKAHKEFQNVLLLSGITDVDAFFTSDSHSHSHSEENQFNSNEGYDEVMLGGEAEDT